MERLLEQLEDNQRAMNTLKRREEDIVNGNWANAFYNYDKRVTLANWNRKVQKRVLSMRFRLLDNLRAFTLKEQQHVSTSQKELLKMYA